MEKKLEKGVEMGKGRGWKKEWKGKERLGGKEGKIKRK